MASALVLADRFGDNDEVEKGGGLYKIVPEKHRSKKSQFRDSSGRDILL